MALRNQPYFPLYTQDFISDEKLRECSAASVGVYIFLMCVFHKSERYGAVSLKPKDKKSGDPLAANDGNSCKLKEIVKAGYILVNANYALAPDYRFPTQIQQRRYR